MQLRKHYCNIPICQNHSVVSAGIIANSPQSLSSFIAGRKLFLCGGNTFRLSNQLQFVGLGEVFSNDTSMFFAIESDEAAARPLIAPLEINSKMSPFSRIRQERKTRRHWTLGGTTTHFRCPDNCAFSLSWQKPRIFAVLTISVAIIQFNNLHPQSRLKLARAGNRFKRARKRSEHKILVVQLCFF